MAIGTAAAILGGAAIGALASSSAAKSQSSAATNAAATQAASADRAADLQYQMWLEQKVLQEPWRAAGVQALNKLAPLSEYKPFNMDQYQADPGYAFRLSEGQKALERSAAARGGLFSGATGKALTRYGQEMGSQEYTNAFNRYQTERAARLQPLQSLAGVGQTTAQQIGQAGQTMASNVGNMYNTGANAMAGGLVGAAGARASGYMGGANALSSALGSGMNMYQQQQLINRLGSPSSSPYLMATSNYTPVESYTALGI